MKPSLPGKAAALLLLTGLAAAACSDQGGDPPSPAPSATASPAATDGPAGTPEPSASIAPASVAVTDIGGHKFREQIVKLLETGLATPSSGGLFEPSAPVTKGDFLRWMTAYDDKGIADADPSTPTFPDVGPDSPDYGWVEGLAAAGRLGAEPGKPLNLEGPLQRGELARLWAWYQDRTAVKSAERDRLYAEVLIGSRDDRKEIPEPYIRAVAHYASLDDGKPYLRTFGDTSRLAAEALVSRSQAAYWIVENAGEESDGDDFAPPPRKVQVEVQGGDENEPAAGAPSDIAGHKREAAVAKLAGQVAGVLDESGAFRPDEAILRAEFIRWMAAYDDKGVIPFRAPEPTYSDVKPEDEGYELVEGLTQAGIISGFPDGTMRLSEPLTREQLTVLWGWYQRYGLVVKPLATEVSEVNLRKFEDRDKVGKIFLGGVQAYVSSNWDVPPYLDTFGADKKLEPQKPVTRAEAAYWITQNAEVEAED
ncbi:S-layer homology domain-containing protein [Paenibacillus albicereus]|uniref:S-layer homology domain-containing protein n=1 Tax=Paenibacillus albicereus TaxID=2726185 RepID=A0A6H2GTP5_9BACL|nr:S-layer homology domain-containing protein [Paenibacillus albicereus]QJC50780.1 S-layer homology domain-containing protein [Paenibacillus albicereus]